MRQLLSGKTAIVTGASSGIGAATARELARRGASVVLAARRTAELAAQAAAITDAGGRAVAVPTDVTDATQVERLAEYARQTFGPADILVNNAGVNWATALAVTPEDEICQVIGVNLLGTILMTRAVLPQMLARHQGAIVSVASVAGRVAIEPLYSGSKFGVRGFSLALRRQLAGSGISVSLVTPGNIRTAMTSSMRQRMPGPELVADTIAGLATRPRREVVRPASYRAIAWLDCLLPGLADVLFRWRHRRDARPGSEGTLSAFAQKVPVTGTVPAADRHSAARGTAVLADREDAGT
ncbi:MAG: SDR family oxidoreductase [Actinobacteria bacterium]|nr:SDR family oxidoreductase [Actinomycetota bacterium]